MPNGTQTYQPESGYHRGKYIPNKVQRRALARPVHKRRVCSDDKVYNPVPFTIQGPIVAGDYTAWTVDKDYWVARVSAEVGKHVSGTHPSDGTPSGTLTANVRRVTKNGGADGAVLASDSRLVINSGKHVDAVNNEDVGDFTEADFAIKRVYRGEQLYVRVINAGSAQGTLVVTVILVPQPQYPT